MRLHPKNIGERLSAMPMAVATVPLAVGIAFSSAVEVPLWAWAVLCTVAAVAVVALAKRAEAAARTALAMLLCATGALLYNVATEGEVPYGEPLEMELQALGGSVATTGAATRMRTEMRILLCRECPSAEGRHVVAWSDSTLRFEEGGRLLASVRIHPFTVGKHADTATFDARSYARMMHHRGFVGSVRLHATPQAEFAEPRHPSLHTLAVGRLKRLLPEGRGRAVLLSMSVGERGEIDRELRHAYSVTGTAHLLAVSGLHVGIVFTLLNLLLWFVPLMRHGNVLRSAAVIAATWLYVVVCGAPPSAVRAAVMFSALQLSLLSTGRHSSLNALGATAFAMLLFDPLLIHDIGFRLSFLAVAGILLWGVPLTRALHTRSRAVNALVGAVAVGASAALATAPAVSAAFGIVSIVGIVLNLFVVALSNAVLFGAMTALFMPVDAVAQWLAEASAWLVGLQNGVVVRAAELPFSHLELRIPEWGEAAAYALFVAATLFAWAVEREKS